MPRAKEVMTAEVVWYARKRGYGAAQTADGETYLFHIKNCRFIKGGKNDALIFKSKAQSLRVPREGDRIVFNTFSKRHKIRLWSFADQWEATISI